MSCKDCKKRHKLCHSKCEDYLAYHKKREEYLSRQQIESDANDYLFKSIAKSKANKGAKSKANKGAKYGHLTKAN